MERGEAWAAQPPPAPRAPSRGCSAGMRSSGPFASPVWERAEMEARHEALTGAQRMQSVPLALLEILPFGSRQTKAISWKSMEDYEINNSHRQQLGSGRNCIKFQFDSVGGGWLSHLQQLSLPWNKKKKQKLQSNTSLN